MMYPFQHPLDDFKNEFVDLADLAATDSPFDIDFPRRLPQEKAYAFDCIKEKVCAYRSSKGKKLLHSADALMMFAMNGQGVSADTTNSLYCFVELKNQKVENIQSVEDPTDNDLMMKAFDCLSICAMTFARNIPMWEIQKRAVFIVVYPQQDYSARFLAVLNQLALGRQGKRRPLWLLDKLLDAGFYRSILTIDDKEFSEIFPELKRGILPKN